MSMIGKAGRAAKAVFLGLLAAGMASRAGAPTAAGSQQVGPPTRTNPPAKSRMRAYKDRRSFGFHQVKKRR